MTNGCYGTDCFKGAIDFVAIYDKDILTPDASAFGFHRVRQPRAADVIDVTYTGDPDGDMIDAGWTNQTGGDEDVVTTRALATTPVLAGEADDTDK